MNQYIAFKSNLMKNILTSLILSSTFSFASFSQCSSANNTGFCAISPGLLAQSFTASCDGDLQSIQFYSANTGTINGGTLNVYNSNSPNGSPAYTQVFSNKVITNPNDSVLFNISGSFQIVSGNEYTVEFNSGTFPMLGGADYIGGDAFLAGNNTGLDFLFDIKVAQHASINSVDFSEFYLYPNPSNGTVNIDTDKEFTLEVVDVAGNVIQEHSNVSSIKIETPGVYFLNFTENNTVTTQKVIVK